MRKLILLLLNLFFIVVIGWFIMWNFLGHSESVMTAKINLEHLSKIFHGMNRDDVSLIMGKPAKVEAYMNADHLIEFQFFRTRGFLFYFQDNDRNFTPIAIDNKSGMLYAVDRNFYEEVLKSSRKKGR